MSNDEGPLTTTVAMPIDYVVDGYVILEVQQLWSDLRWRVGTDDRRSNMSFKATGVALVALPTRENPPPPPEEIEGYKVITLDEYIHAVMAVMEANEQIRIEVITKLQEKKQSEF